MKKNPSIQVESSGDVISFLWRDFDGDDCFDGFFIEVKQNGTTKNFDFGACAVYGLRKLSRFFRDSNQESVSGGFQNPDPCFFDVHRDGDTYLLSVRFERGGFSAQFKLRSALVTINDEFLIDY